MCGYFITKFFQLPKRDYEMKFAVIGNPIEKSLSPQLHEILYEKLNILNCSFEKIHIEKPREIAVS